MSNSDGEARSLGDLRQEIDAIDDALCGLLERRFDAVERIRAAKLQTGQPVGSPIRPAREAEILRRLLLRPKSRVPNELKLRLWRAIMCAATLNQSHVSVHLSKDLYENPEVRIMARDYFGAIPVIPHDSVPKALALLRAQPGDLCLVGRPVDWREIGENLSIVGSLPAWRRTSAPHLFVIGQAASEPSGDDETILIGPADGVELPLGEVKWKFRDGSHGVWGLRGFLDLEREPLLSLVQANSSLGLRIAGRYPSPLEVSA
jgi:chorismate mutase